MTTILVIDDHPIVAQGCRQLIEDAGLGTSVEANSSAEALRAIHRFNPDVIIVDLGIDGNELAGLDLIERIRAGSKAAVLVFSMHRDPIIVSRSLNAGANGYLVKDSAATKLVEAVRTVANGRPYLDHEIAMQLALHGPDKNKKLLADLTARELQILTLLAKGKPYSEIASSLRVSYKTVVNSSAKLKTLLGAKTLSELIRSAMECLSSVETFNRPQIDLNPSP
jgi:two-component system, NarL family, invasion response regulator UvrY